METDLYDELVIDQRDLEGKIEAEEERIVKMREEVEECKHLLAEARQVPKPPNPEPISADILAQKNTEIINLRRQILQVQQQGFEQMVQLMEE